ncbi:tRNA3(Ser)-specific nuclease WapA [BD1-7 clade bacterium]|uniref:tRNA3(Ser)-specific nuclease WapA n=1 Tax=BD1-7 clade bacterium TaxID=2029982 RepID=A0A5S9NYT4_9GAMM|nr:tRNA3(Ser)-specific nuclease WapA [BD1-7 clade bacterium]
MEIKKVFTGFIGLFAALSPPLVNAQTLHSLTGSVNPDIIIADQTAGRLNGGGDSDYLIGGSGDDTFVYGANSGHDIINSRAGNNTLEFTDNLTVASFQFGISADQKDLVFNLSDGSGSLTLKNFLTATDTIDTIVFANGQQFTQTSLLQAFGLPVPTSSLMPYAYQVGKATGEDLQGTPAPDLLVPRNGTATITGGDGDDLLVGRLGYIGYEQFNNEVYYFDEELNGVVFPIAPNSGNDTIVAYEGFNEIHFLGGVTLSDISFSRSGDTMILKNKNTQETTSVINFFKLFSIIDRLVFSDGSDFTVTQMWNLYGEPLPFDDGGPPPPPPGGGFPLPPGSPPGSGFAPPLSLPFDLPPIPPYPPFEHPPANMLAIGTAFNGCISSTNTDGASGYGLTDDQLATVNNLPVVVSTPVTDSYFDDDYSYDVQVADADNDEICFSLIQAPEYMSIDPATGHIIWFPYIEDAGLNEIIVGITDNRSNVITHTFTIDVFDPNQPPTLTGTPYPEAYATYKYLFQPTSIDPEGGGITYAIASGPAGMTVVNNRVEWTPTIEQLGVHEYSVSATDDGGKFSTHTYSVEVFEVTPIADLAWNESRLPKSGVRYSVATNDDLDKNIGTPRIYERDDDNEIVYDRVNDLVWLDTPAVHTERRWWTTGRQYCNGLNHAGITDWRMPLRLELAFLIEHHRSVEDGIFIHPAFKEHAEYTYADDGSEFERVHNFHSAVDFEDGVVTFEPEKISVRCVSGDPAFDIEFYGPAEKDFVVDRVNGLMWQDDEDAAAIYYDGGLEAGINYCENLELGGYDDWRMPNVSESQTLLQEVDYKRIRYQSGAWNDYDTIEHFPLGYGSKWLSSTPTTDAKNSSHKLLAFTQDLIDKFWFFQNQINIVGQGNVASNIHQRRNFFDISSYSNRCVRNYAEPVAVVVPAETTYTVLQNESKILDGTTSYDDDGETLDHQWVNAETNELIFEASTFDISTLSIGEHAIKLAVVDADNLTQYSETINVTVLQGIEIVLGNDGIFEEGTTVSLDASESTAGTPIIAYRWMDIVTGEILSTDPQFDINDLPIGVYNYRLEVDTESGHTAYRNFAVEVAPTPIINLAIPSPVFPNQSVIFDASGSTVSPGSILAYKWTIDSVMNDEVGHTLSQTFTAPGQYSVQLEVLSDKGITATHTLSYEVLTPTATAIIAGIPTMYENKPVQLDGTGSSVNYGDLSYSWKFNGDVIATEPTHTIAEINAGTHTIELTVTAEFGAIDTASTTLTVLETRPLHACPMPVVENDDNFADNFPASNIDWQGGDNPTVDQIADAFNYARVRDNSINALLVMPTQIDWDAMDVPEKATYLINAERVARHIKPYAGHADVVNTIALDYANFTRDNNKVIGHFNDGQSPQERLDSDSDIADNRDGAVRDENTFGQLNLSVLPDEGSIAARAVYEWVYADADWFVDLSIDGEPWAHRKSVLQVGFNDNHGASDSEGILGFGLSLGDYNPTTTPDLEPYGAVFIMNVIDQSADWGESINTVDVSAANGCVTDHQVVIDSDSVPTVGLSELRISPDTVLSVPGNEIELTITAHYDNGDVQDVTEHVSFLADDQSVVSIENGVVYAERAGHAQLFAEIGGKVSNRVHVWSAEPTNTDSLINTPAESIIQHVPANATVESYDSRATSIYTGFVHDRNDTGISDVQVSFLNRPELGSVTTDSDGRFIIAGPAGRQVAVYEKTGYVVVQRRATGASNSWVNFETVTLLERDSHQTLIDISSGATQVHQSTLISDEDGERRATIVFSGITAATVRSMDGRERPLTEMLLSATEFETPESMPGALPSTTAFTFANDLHVAGTRYDDTIEFNNDVVMFVDNFLGFDVGEIVPIGYFNRSLDQWIASDNGVVVVLIDTDQDGIVDGLDYTGDDVADDLNENGSTADEAIGLDSYSAGDTLWWGAFNHFTSIDYNWSSVSKLQPNVAQQKDKKECGETGSAVKTGSYVNPYEQTFHEDIPIPGTDLMLHYTSERAPGFQHKATVSVSGDEIPDDLEDIVVRLEVGGHVFEKTIAPKTNKDVEFIWDGEDITRHRPTGDVLGRVFIGYRYRVPYAGSGNASTANLPLSAFPKQWAIVGGIVTSIEARDLLTVWDTHTITFKNTYQNQLANGWGIDKLHNFDPLGTLYFGDGEAMEVEPQSRVLRTGITESQVEGDDGHYQTGSKSIDYEITKDGFLLDKVTGLEWEYTQTPLQTRNKAHAAAYCAALPSDSFVAWRLPTPKELGYTVDKSGAAQDEIIYDLNRVRHVWHLRTLNFYNDLLTTVCVRGQSLDTQYRQGLVRDDDQSVVTDRSNGLMWQDTPENESLHLPWEEAIEHCEASTHAGHADWRLPNANELLYVLPNNTFIHQTELDWPADPELFYWDENAFFRLPYWASTPHPTREDRAWAVESIGLNRSVFLKEHIYNVRCVRNSASLARFPYTFDNRGNHTTTFDLDSGVTTKDFDYADFDDTPQLVSITDQFGNKVVINRGSDGKPQSIVSPDGHVTELTIDGNNDLKNVAYDDGTNFTFNYEDDTGLLTEKIDQNGNSFVHHFDEEGRVYKTTDSENGRWDFVRSIINGNQVEYGFITAMADDKTFVQQVLPDGSSWLKTTYKNGSVHTRTTSADKLTVKETYGGVTTTTNNSVDPKTLQEFPNSIKVKQANGLTSNTNIDRIYGSGGVDFSSYVETTDINGAVFTVAYNANNGSTMITSPEGRVTTTNFDPDSLSVQSIVRSGLNETTFTYDARGRVKTETVSDRTITFDRNDAGFVSKITRPDGLEASFTHDDFGRIETIVYADDNSVTIEYDNNGNLLPTVTPTGGTYGRTVNGVNKVASESAPTTAGNSNTTTHEYDNDHRLKAINYPSGNRIENTFVNNELVNTTLPEGSITYAHDNGKLVNVTEGSETLSYDYNGSLLTAVEHGGVLNEIISYQHNNDFEVNNITYAGASSDITYDNDGLLTGVHGYSVVNHALHGLVTSISDDDYTRTYTHNQYGEIESTQISVGDTSYGYILGYDNVGRIDSKTETTPVGAIEYTYDYDNRDRLTQVYKDGVLVEHYTFDANGNRLQTTSHALNTNTVAATYNLGDQLLTRGDDTYEYDDDGRLKKKTAASQNQAVVTTYQYTSLGRLQKVTMPDKVVSYAHNALGNRVSKLVDGNVVEHYLWENKTRLLATFNANGSLKQRFEYTTGHTPTSYTEGGNKFYILSNHLGTPRFITNADGEVVKAIDYDSYGNIVSDSNPTVSFPFGFAGGLYDVDAGLTRFGYRDYDAETGRWTARDPIGLGDGPNIYSYVWNNPLNGIDISGLSTLVYNDSTGALVLIGADGKAVGLYYAANNASSKSNGKYPEGTHEFAYHKPHEGASSDSAYGTNGNFVFKVPNRTGMGVHSGRATKADGLGRSGPDFATLGCIRTTDAGTKAIQDLHASDPLKSLKVIK